MPRQMSEKEALEYIDTAQGWATLSTIGSDGYPHSVPIGWFRVHKKIYMGCIDKTQKDEITEHMNSDHPDTVLLYLQHYANLPLSVAGGIQDVSETEIKIAANMQGRDGRERTTMKLVLPLLRRVENIKEAEHVMVEMFFEAKRILEGQPA